MITYAPPENNGLEILFQDEYIIIINKPNGLLTVPGRGEDKQDCLESRVNCEYQTARVVHRLDMSTSGVIVLALDKNTHRQLSELFAKREIRKKYTAVVDGIINSAQGEINQPLLCDWPNRPRQKIDLEHGKPSCTNYRVIEIDPDSNTTRVELLPKTGRTHQLRVHMQFIQHAILGDELYACERVVKCSDRLMLHATFLAFQHPVTGMDLEFTSQVPF